MTRSGFSWPERFLPGLSNTLAALVAGYMWTSVCALRRAFSERERFTVFADSSSGADIQNALREGVIESSEQSLKKILVLFIFQLILLGITASVAAIRLPVMIVLIALGMSATGLYGIFRVFRDEERCASTGFGVKAPDRSRRIRFIGMMLGGIGLLSLLLTPFKAILPLSLIRNLLLWFLGLFQFLPHVMLPAREQPIPDFPPMEPLIRPEFALDEPITPWAGWKYIQYSFFGFIGILFVYFMLKPLFSKFNLSNLLFSGRMSQVIVQWFRSLGESFRIFFNRSDSSVALDRKNEKEVSAAVFEAYSTVQKKRLKTSLNIFARLIVWGNNRAPWKTSYAPAEYCLILSFHVPEQKQAIVQCGELFEQELYSSRPLSREQQTQFRDLVESITME
ncbi:hypothetical protein FACS1894164_14050 [Spirochaetia bacterium]|nr:hypothetical protein FACS1894164_14050 [Spirochaetia bacterium]